MAGATVQVRAQGRPGDVISHLVASLTACVNDLELLRATSNTANGGAWSLAASALTGYKITLLNG